LDGGYVRPSIENHPINSKKETGYFNPPEKKMDTVSIQDRDVVGGREKRSDKAEMILAVHIVAKRLGMW